MAEEVKKTTSETAEQTASPEAKSTNPNPKSKWPLVVIGLLLFLLIPLGGYFAYNQLGLNNQKAGPTPAPQQTEKQTASPSPTNAPDPTADWKTYTNTASKYSVKFPSDMFVRLICPDEELVLRTRKETDTKDEETFETCGRGGRFTIEVVTAESFTEPVTDDYVEVTKSNITIDGVAARDYISVKKPTAEGPIPDWSEDIYFEKAGIKHLIHFDRGVSEDIKTNFLSSFKFL